MRRAAVTFGALLAVLLAAATAGAQGTKTVRGEVTSTTADSVTVKVGDKDMTFKVDAKTRVTARGGSTATREARAEGKPGAPFADLVKAGQGVEVAYHEAGMHADSIRVLPAVPPPPPPAGSQAMTATGVVTAVSGTSLTVKLKTGESTFTIGEKTKVVGTGMGTKAREMKDAGASPTITSFVAAGDTVAVRYTEAGGTKTASEVRVTQKGT
jgi:hypothetical protein